MTLGERIRHFRLERGLTLDQVASQASLSKAYISQIENDRANPSLTSLRAVMAALDLPMSALFDGEPTSESAVTVVRRGSRKRISIPESSMTYELLSPDAQHDVEFIMTSAEPGEGTGSNPIIHRGQECGLVLKGTVKLWIRTEEHVLEEGDSYYLESNVPHRWENIGDTVAELIWAVTPPSF
jgi:transcriptional regulator with XRE-family HTH domain